MLSKIFFKEISKSAPAPDKPVHVVLPLHIFCLGALNIDLSVDLHAPCGAMAQSQHAAVAHRVETHGWGGGNKFGPGTQCNMGRVKVKFDLFISPIHFWKSLLFFSVCIR